MRPARARSRNAAQPGDHGRAGPARARATRPPRTERPPVPRARSCSPTRSSTRSGSARTGRRTRSTSRSTSSTGWRRRATASATRSGHWATSTSERSASPPTWRRSCSPRPSGEVEIFLATQLVDEARHAAFFDRFMAEVLALEPEDIRGRLGSLEAGMSSAWKEMFDGHLRGIAERLKAEPGQHRPVRRGRRRLPPRDRGRAGDDRSAPDPQVPREPRPLPGLPGGLLAGRAGRAPAHRLRRGVSSRTRSRPSRVTAT